MMLHVFQPRGTGKTTALIRYAVENGCDILVTTGMMAQCVLDTAVYMGIPGQVNRNRNNGYIRIGDTRILSLHDVTSPCNVGRSEKPIVIDELDYVLERMFRQRVAGYSVTYPGPEDKFVFTSSAVEITQDGLGLMARPVEIGMCAGCNRLGERDRLGYCFNCARAFP